MAHEITETDGAVYAGMPAWHGLGRVVEQAPTPAELIEGIIAGWAVAGKSSFTLRTSSRR